LVGLVAEPCQCLLDTRPLAGEQLTRAVRVHGADGTTDARRPARSSTGTPHLPGSRRARRAAEVANDRAERHSVGPGIDITGLYVAPGVTGPNVVRMAAPLPRSEPPPRSRPACSDAKGEQARARLAGCYLAWA